MMSRALLFLFLFVVINGESLRQIIQKKPFEEPNPEHLNELLKKVIEKKAEDMTPDEKQFYEFKLHDLNGDGSLDGLEIFWLIQSYEEEDHKNTTVDELIYQTDEALKSHDSNSDGYLTYSEIHL